MIWLIYENGFELVRENKTWKVERNLAQTFTVLFQKFPFLNLESQKEFSNKGPRDLRPKNWDLFQKVSPSTCSTEIPTI